MEGLHAVLNNQSADTIDINPAVADVATVHAAIGWNQILKGRFAKLWSLSQDKHLGPRATVKANGSTWMIKVIEATLMEWLKLWKLRNEDRHGRDIESRRQAETWQRCKGWNNSMHHMMVR